MASKYPGVTATTDGTTAASSACHASRCRDGRRAFEATQRDVRRDARRLDPWNRAHPLEDSIQERHDGWCVRIPRGRREDRRRHHARGREPRIETEQMAKAGEEQRRANQEDDRQSDLRHHQRPPEQTRRAPAGAETAAVTEHLIDGHRARRHRRHQTGQHSHNHRDARPRSRSRSHSSAHPRHWAGSPVR